MKFLKKYNEVAEYHNLNGDDDYEITKLVRDENHDYKYCENILYEIYSSEDFVLSVDEIDFTEENLFYEDQIERYIQYFEGGGGTQSFPVQESDYKDCSTLEEMMEYLTNEDFDLMYELLHDHYFILYDKIDDILSNYDEYGILDYVSKNGLRSPFFDIRSVEDLDNYYDEENDLDKDDDDYDEALLFNEDIYNGMVTILEYWKENSAYTLTDLNHRFTALKRMGIKNVYVDPS